MSRKKKNVEIRFPKGLFDSLKSYLLQDSDEKHAFLFGRKVEEDSKEVVLVREVVVFDPEEIETSATSVKVDKDLAYKVFLKFYMSEYDVMVSCHSHPFETRDVWFSGIDNSNDRYLFDYFAKEIEPLKKGAKLYTMVFGQETIAARGYDHKKRRFEPLSRVTVLDAPMRYYTPTNLERPRRWRKEAEFDKELFDRQIRAFGSKGQKSAAQLKVALVGVGGTGSILAEGLVRLGFRDFVLVDGDRLEKSNLNRWQGAEPKDVGEYKVDVAKKRMERMADGVDVHVLRSDLFCRDAIDAIKTCDVLIGAVDDDKARYVLNRVALSYMIPYFDLSSGIVTKDGTIEKVASRNVVVVPGVTECMVCTDHYLDRSKLAYAFVDENTHRELVRQKYIKGDNVKEPSPAVYGLNMLSASTLMLELMNLLFGYKELYGNVYIDYLKAKEPFPIAWSPEPPSKRCIECRDRLGMGDEERIWELFERRKPSAFEGALNEALEKIDDRQKAADAS